MSRIFFYVNTGHRVGLDRFRRAGAIMEHLQAHDITLLTNDFRIASSAKAFHFKKATGIDVIRNMPQIAKRFDTLIYDSNEHNENIYSDMKEFFTPFIEIDNSWVAVDTTYEEKITKKENVVLFFGDDDYEKDLLTLAQESELNEVEILLGYYYFLEMDDALRPLCKEVHENEEYEEVIKSAGLVITSSYQTALEASVTGSKVVYMQRVDYVPEYATTLEALGIKVVPMQTITKSMIASWLKEITPVNITNKSRSIANEIEKLLF